jgi:hypothetical protein
MMPFWTTSVASEPHTSQRNTASLVWYTGQQAKKSHEIPLAARTEVGIGGSTSCMTAHTVQLCTGPMLVDGR